MRARNQSVEVGAFDPAEVAVYDGAAADEERPLAERLEAASRNGEVRERGITATARKQLALEEAGDEFARRPVDGCVSKQAAAEF